MKNIVFKSITTVLLVASLCSSCKKYLYEAPITSTYGAEFWTSQTAVEQAALAMYGQLRTSLRATPAYNNGEGSYFVNGDLTSGAFVPCANDAFLASIKSSYSTPFNFNYVPYGADVLANWSRFYQLIAQCNLILQNVPQMSSAYFSSESVRKAYLGEALFMRAFTYFYITRIWGDPVLVTKTYNDVDYGKIPALARTPEAAALDTCIADLKTAATYLSYGGGDITKTIRANKGTTYALLAHIYEWKHNYDSAHAYCQLVINNGGYSLEPMASYKNIWQGQTSNESIFEVAMKYNSSDPNFTNQSDWAEAQFNFFGTYLKGPLVNDVHSSCWIAPTNGLLESIYDTTNDARWKNVLTNYITSNGDPTGHMLLKYTNFIYQKPDTKTLPYINNNLVLFRLSDIILLDAEALAYKGNLTGAAAQLALTENRAGISSYKSANNQYDMVDEVVMERGRELMGEGQWYYDLIRTEQTQGWLEYIGYPLARITPANKGYYWPLDMSTLFPQDALLTQNPWWTAH